MASMARVGRIGQIFLIRPNPVHKWSDPTRPNTKLSWNSGPDPTQPILHDFQYVVVMSVAPHAVNIHGKKTTK